MTKLGAHVVFAGPQTLLPDGIETIVDEADGTLARARSLEEALDGADVVMMLRIQL